MSCTPSQIPIAKLSAAQASIIESKKGLEELHLDDIGLEKVLFL